MLFDNVFVTWALAVLVLFATLTRRNFGVFDLTSHST